MMDVKVETAVSTMPSSDPYLVGVVREAEIALAETQPGANPSFKAHSTVTRNEISSKKHRLLLCNCLQAWWNVGHAALLKPMRALKGGMLSCLPQIQWARIFF